MSHCDYWWFAGDVEWCDLVSGPCKCAGWHESCQLKGRRKRNNGRDNQHVPERPFRMRAKAMRQARHAEQGPV